MLTIARFNWPLYAVAVLVLLASGGGLLLPGHASKVLSLIVFFCAAYFVFISLAVSHWVYDRSDLYRWSWLDHELQGRVVERAVFCHSGFDECSAELRRKFTNAQWTILDHFDPQQMTEASIQRARALFPPIAGTLPCPANSWPLPAQSIDLVIAPLAIHELRSDQERTAWFAEARRCLRQGGCIVLVEHMRDAANFLAFGPGFWHFHSHPSWKRSWENARLQCIHKFRVTPFIQIFVLSE